MYFEDVSVSPPPSFLRLAGHPVRWRLLNELARSDRRVRELTRLVGRRQSLVSYHLGCLRAERLVKMRRSSADGRDAYYALDLSRCGELLTAVGSELHPALRPAGDGALQAAGARPRVLFLCTGNSARSQIAEALAERLGAVAAFSAGSHPKPVHPEAVRVMRERGIDLSRRRSKHLSEFANQRFDYVVSLCDRVREVCPEFPGHPNVIHWSIPDPSRDGDFARTADEVAARIPFLLAQIDHDREEVS
jgi:protein-tyrosine-phosphatase/DNA-binding transcriptional ArsR family regulator